MIADDAKLGHALPLGVPQILLSNMAGPYLAGRSDSSQTGAGQLLGLGCSGNPGKGTYPVFPEGPQTGGGESRSNSGDGSGRQLRPCKAHRAQVTAPLRPATPGTSTASFRPLTDGCR